MSNIDIEITKQEQLVATHSAGPAQWFRLGRLRRRNNQFTESIICFSRCVALDSENLDAGALMGFSFLDLFR